MLREIVQAQLPADTDAAPQGILTRFFFLSQCWGKAGQTESGCTVTATFPVIILKEILLPKYLSTGNPCHFLRQTHLSKFHVSRRIQKLSWNYEIWTNLSYWYFSIYSNIYLNVEQFILCLLVVLRKLRYYSVCIGNDVTYQSTKQKPPFNVTTLHLVLSRWIFYL